MKRLLLTIAASAVLAANAQAATTTYTDRALFEGTLTSQLTDTYEPSLGYPVPFGSLSNVEMNAVLGQTQYTPTGFSNNNLFGFAPDGGSLYCAGCNGSFRLSFGNTSYGTQSGVFGVGVDIVGNSEFLPYSAFVTFGDETSQSYQIPVVIFGGPSGFFGITSDKSISSIHFGLSDGSATTDGSFLIDNLTIGFASAAPEPATWAMMLLGFAMVGVALRKRARVRSTVSYSL